MVTLRYQHAYICVAQQPLTIKLFFYLLLMLIADFVSLDSHEQKRIAHSSSSRIITRDLVDSKIEHFGSPSNESYESLNLVCFKLC